MPAPHISDILIAIEDGSWDNYLDEISQIIGVRRQVLRQRVVRQKLKTIGVGDRVRVMPAATIKPRYLAGWTGEVVEVRRGGKILVKGRPIRKFESGQIVCPVAVLEKIHAS